MSGQPQQQESFSRVKPGDTINLFYFVANIHRTAIATLIRRDYGSEALGWNAFLAMILIFMVYAATLDQVVLFYLGVWFFCQIGQRIRTFWNFRKGIVIHSQYAGYPYLAMMVPFVRRQSTATGIIEPMMCLFGGVLLCPLSVNLGGFIMCGLLSFMVTDGIEREIRRQRLVRMHDAEIEQRWYSNSYKNGGHTGEVD